MSLLPPVGWADVATKHDLHELERRLDLRFESMDHRFEALKHELKAHTDQTARDIVRTMAFTMVGTMLTLASLCLGTVVLVA